MVKTKQIKSDLSVSPVLKSWRVAVVSYRLSLETNVHADVQVPLELSIVFHSTEETCRSEM